MAQVNQNGGRWLIADSNHMPDHADAGGRFWIQDHDHNADLQQSGQQDQTQSSDRQQGGEGKKPRRGRQFL